MSGPPEPPPKEQAYASSTGQNRHRSAQSSLNSRHHFSGRKSNGPRRNVSYTKRAVTDADAYTYALRAAYLSYLLQPRQKRVQHVANTSKPIQRSSTSINDMVKDFSLMRDSKSTKFPHGFMAELDKRLSGVLVGKEKMPEYADPLVKRTFAVFLNEFKSPTFRKSMEKDRKVEDLLLIFFSKATSELQKGKAFDDDSWKLMVDRHVALFVRLISSTLYNNDWAKERPELAGRLKTLEQKLLHHDQDLSTGTQSIEVEVPRSYEIKDMPLVIRLCRIFSKPTAVVQADIDAHKDEWTEQAALRDLKEYQNHIMLNTGFALGPDDFAAEDAYEQWKKGEISDISQMILTIIQSNPTLAKGSGGADSLQHLRSSAQTIDGAANGDAQSLDMSALNINDGSPTVSRSGSIDTSGAKLTYIPNDLRAYYRALLKNCIAHDLHDEENGAEDDSPRIFSPQTLALLNECAHRWRIPVFSRTVLFIDIIRELHLHQEIILDTVDTAFVLSKEPPETMRKTSAKSVQAQLSLLDRTKWPIHDLILYQNALSSLHDALLRDLYQLFQQCYESKPPSIASIMYILEAHIYDDPDFSKTPEDLDEFGASLASALRERAHDKYNELLADYIDGDAGKWEFYHVIKLGQAVTGLCDKIQKRYRKNPEVMGVNPLRILMDELLPAFAKDSSEIVKRIMTLAQESGEELPIQDGFELYKELAAFRQVFTQAIHDTAFPYSIENLLSDFVVRWIQSSDSKMLEWIEAAAAHDSFQVHSKDAQGTDLPDDQRHSQSVVDVFRIFNTSVQQVVQLEWDDDLQYAKFMTSISKSIGKGIARYCELIEARFAKEMDRQTAEQLDSTTQVTQKEKWLAAAKDFYQTAGRINEKIEPFNFLAESFVKINNVEYAVLQLDEVEKEINVDACAEVVNRLDPPPPPNVRHRRGDVKFLFTIKIVEAEDLKAGDMNGSSDPYVVLGDEYQKRLAKTRTVYQSLNPRWDETVDILTSGPLNVIMTVWDWDIVGDHDCLGRTSLKLDPSHFSDFLPREYWLDLDTQGRVLVRVSMEGERDDIQYYFGKAFRTLKKTERDMTRRVTDKLNAYIMQCLSRRTLQSLLSQGNTIGGVSMNQVRGYFSKVSGRPSSVMLQSGSAPTITQEQVQNALRPLLQYFDDNFAIMKQTLTEAAMIMVMTRLWKEVLVTVEALLVPPLSDKPSSQRPLGQAEVDVVYKWLQILFDFFHAFDDESRTALGVPHDVLKSPKYHDLQNLNFFYFESTENLIRTSESMATATLKRQQDGAHRSNAAKRSSPFPGTRRTKSVMLTRNLGTMRKAKEDKRREAQAEPSDDMILRILRMRPEAERYLRDRNRQKERLAAAAAAEAIVRQSLAGSQQQQQRVGATSPFGAGNAATRARRWGTIRE